MPHRHASRKKETSRKFQAQHFFCRRSWQFGPIWKNLRQIGSLSPGREENIKKWKPPPRLKVPWSQLQVLTWWRMGKNLPLMGLNGLYASTHPWNQTFSNTIWVGYWHVLQIGFLVNSRIQKHPAKHLNILCYWSNHQIWLKYIKIDLDSI